MGVTGMTPEELKSRTLSSLLWKFLERGGVAAGGLLVQIVMARLLTPEDFGALALMLVFVSIGTVFAVSGFNTALVQAREVTALDFDTVFWISLTVALVLWGAIGAAAPWIASVFSLPLMTNPLRVLGALLVLNALYAVLTAEAQRELAFKKVFRASLTAMVTASVFGIGTALAGGGLWALVIFQLTNVGLAGILLFLQSVWRPRFHFSGRSAARLFRFSWKLLVSALMDVGYQSVTDVIIGQKYAAASLGVVSQGKKYPGAIASVLDGAIQPVMLSAVARVQEDVPAAKALVRRAMKTSTLAVVPLMTLLAVLADPLVRWGLGEQWSGAVIFFQMYCFIYALWPVHTSNLSAINGMGRSDLFLKLEIVKKITGLSILAVAVTCFDSPVAIVAGSMVGGVIGMFINAFPNRRVLGYGYWEQAFDLAPIWGVSLACGGIGYGILVSLTLPPWLTILLVSAAFGVLFLAMGCCFRCEALVYVLQQGRKLCKRRLVRQ